MRNDVGVRPRFCITDGAAQSHVHRRRMPKNGRLAAANPATPATAPQTRRPKWGAVRARLQGLQDIEDGSKGTGIDAMTGRHQPGANPKGAPRPKTVHAV